MKTTRIDNVISEVKQNRTGSRRAWIIDDNGNISPDAIVGDILPYLTELKDYEISVSDNWISDFLTKDYDIDGYTYNDGCNISNDILYRGIKTSDGNVIMLFAVHVGLSDARIGFSSWFACKFSYIDEFLQLETVYQTKDIIPGLCADICIFSECYNVFDYEAGKDIGEFWEIEKSELLKSIDERKQEEK